MTRKAFSLIEVLVAFSVISLMLTMLLPAVNASREAARSVACRNNLKQIGLAIQLHEYSLGHLPSAGWGTKWTGDSDLGSGPGQPGGWAFSILPYAELNNVYDLASDGDPNSITPTQKAGASKASKTQMGLFLCTSRRSESVSAASQEVVWNMDQADSVSKTDYAVNAGDTFVPWGPGPDPQSDPNVIGFIDMRSSNGVAHQASRVTYAHILDGLSNTYLLGEKRLCLSDPTQDDHGALFGADVDNARWTSDPPAADGEAPGMNFGSAHAGSFGMLMCDGSVKFTEYEIDQETHRELGNIRDCAGPRDQ